MVAALEKFKTNVISASGLKGYFFGNGFRPAIGEVLNKQLAIDEYSQGAVASGAKQILSRLGWARVCQSSGPKSFEREFAARG